MGRFSHQPGKPPKEISTGGSAKPAVQRKLDVNSPGDRHEQEADAMAERVTGASALHDAAGGVMGAVPGGQVPSPSPGLVSQLAGSKGKGTQLPAGTKDFMEGAFSKDFSRVRLHKDEEAAAMSAGVQARAFTHGNDIYFNEGQYSESSTEGKNLLAHELTHVVQQSGAGAQSAPAQGVVQRQPAPQGTGGKQAPAGPASFSVNQGAYLAEVNKALARMSGTIVDHETLATTVQPILQAMVANVIWQDAAGVKQGGAVTKYTTDTGLTLNLTLILNDDPNAIMDGEFTSHGATDGTMEVFIHGNAGADDLAETLFHESMHLVRWLINRSSPGLKLPSSSKTSSGIAGAIGTLDSANWTSQITTIGKWLDALAQAVNPRRASGPQITRAQTDKMAGWLMEEIGARVESEVFRQAYDTQQALASRAGTLIIGTGQGVHVNQAMLHHYIFDFSRVFLPADQTGLDANDQYVLDMLVKILEGLFLNRVARRFNSFPYLVGSGVQKPQVPLNPTPLQQPPFSQLPLP